MNFEPSRWRLIQTPPATGAWNMAVDEAVLESVGRGDSLPTLRLFSWEPPCISLGYAQPVADVDMDSLHSLGWHLVRRPTGGRAILHTDELTYSVCAPLHEPRVTGTVLESYSRLAQALLMALNILTLPAQAKENYGTPRQNTNPICFEVPSNYEITVGGKKLIGSAQARRKEGILQHGSLPICGDLTRIIRVLRFADENERIAAPSQLLEHATTVETVLNKQVSWGQAAEALKDAFEKTLNLTFEIGTLSPTEGSRADELVLIKYSAASWNERV